MGRVSGGGNDPGSIVAPTVLANAYLMQRGYTMVWSGWDKSAGTNTTKTASSPLTITLPIAKNANGTSITGPAFEYIVTSNGTTTSFTLSYPAFSTSKTKDAQNKPILTHRIHLNNTPIEVSNWSYNASG